MLGVVLLIVAVMIVAIGESIASSYSSVSQYQSSGERPPEQPPDVVFKIVWPVLYACLGISVYLSGDIIFSDGRAQSKWHAAALTFFFITLALTAAWSPVFLDARAYGTALGLMIALEVSAVASFACYLVASVRKQRSVGGARGACAWLLLPFIGWIGFALAVSSWFLQHAPTAMEQSTSSDSGSSETVSKEEKNMLHGSDDFISLISST